jgi:hypothetical protein
MNNETSRIHMALHNRRVEKGRLSLSLSLFRSLSLLSLSRSLSLSPSFFSLSLFLSRYSRIPLDSIMSNCRETNVNKIDCVVCVCVCVCVFLGGGLQMVVT